MLLYAAPPPLAKSSHASLCERVKGRFISSKKAVRVNAASRRASCECVRAKRVCTHSVCMSTSEWEGEGSLPSALVTAQGNQGSRKFSRFGRGSGQSQSEQGNTGSR